MALFVGRLARDARPRDLEDLFYPYGRILRCDVKVGYGFIEFEDRRDAEDAIRGLNGADLLGSSIAVEWAKGTRRSNDSDACFRCGGKGHWARDCTEAPSYGRGRRSPPRGRRRSYSRSPSRSPRRRSPQRRRRDSRSPSPRGRRRSDSRSPSPRDRRSRSRSPSPTKGRSSRSPLGSPRGKRSRESSKDRPRSSSKSPERKRRRSGSRSPSPERKEENGTAHEAEKKESSDAPAASDN